MVGVTGGIEDHVTGGGYGNVEPLFAGVGGEAAEVTAGGGGAVGVGAAGEEEGVGGTVVRAEGVHLLAGGTCDGGGRRGGEGMWEFV